MFLVKVCVIVTALFVNAVQCKIGFGWLNATEQIKYFGYPLEIHEAVTDDGYILELHRIPHGLREASANKSSGKPVAFLMHGTLCTSGGFTSNYRDRSLAFILAEKGYDVWLGNQRGTPFSLRHKYLDQKNDREKYWNFTVASFGLSDLPAFINYVLNETGQSYLHYVGHSQGNIGMFIMLAERPEYNNKMQVISLGPISYFKHFPNIVGRILLKVCDTFQSLLNTLGVYKVGISIRVTSKFQHAFPLLYEIIFYAVLGGVRSKIFDKSLFPAIAPNIGGDVAVKVLAHYDQLHKSGRFGYYDYGKAGNMAEYGQESPPNFNIQNIKAPISVFYANKDYLASRKDLLHFVNQLPNLVFLKEMPYKYYSHLDFIWSKTVNEDVYDKVLEIFEQKK